MVIPQGGILSWITHAIVIGHEQLLQESADRPGGAGFFNIGVCYFQMGKHSNAIKAFEQSLNTHPIWPTPMPTLPPPICT